MLPIIYKKLYKHGITSQMVGDFGVFHVSGMKYRVRNKIVWLNGICKNYQQGKNT